MRPEFFIGLMNHARASADYARFLPRGLFHGDAENYDFTQSNVDFPTGIYQTGDNAHEEQDTSGDEIRRQAIAFTYFSETSKGRSGDKQGMEFSKWMNDLTKTFETGNPKIDILDRTVVSDSLLQEEIRNAQGNVVWRTVLIVEFLVNYEAD